MSNTVSFGGSSFDLPGNREPKGWGLQLANFLVAVSEKAIPTTGGSKVLTAELNFGSNYGLVAPYFKSSSSNLAASGILRLANNEGIGWRNALNNADLIFKVNASNQLEYNGSTLSSLGNKLSDFAATTSAELAGVITDETGSGSLVFSNSPTLVTPTLGAAVAASINKIAFTSVPTGATLTLADGKTVTLSNTLTFTGTDGSSVAFGAGGTVAYTSNKLSAFAATTSAELASKISDETGSGSLVFASGPTLVAPTVDDGLVLNHEVAPSAPASGKVLLFPKSDNKLYIKDSSGVETAVGTGSGSGGVNYITNPDAESNTTDWATYADAAAATPADGTGGSPTVTWTRNTTTPLRGNADFKYSKPASNCQGQGVAFPFTISVVDKGYPHLISFDFNTSAANYAAGDLAIYVYDVTNGTLITPTTTSLPKGTTKITVGFNATTSTSYRLILHQAGTSALAYDLYFDNFKVSTDPIVVGAAITDEYDMALTFTNFTASSYVAKASRSGPFLFLRVSINVTAVTGQMSVNLPSGHTIPSTANMYGHVKATDSGVGYHVGSISRNSASSIRFDSDDGALEFSTAVPMTWASGDILDFFAVMPITEFAGGSVIMGTGAQCRFYADDGTSDVFGDAGALVPNVAFGAGATSRDITMSAAQSFRSYYVEINYRGNGWCKASDIFPYATGHNNNAGNTVGVQGVWTSSTNFRVSFGNRGTAVNTSLTDNGVSAWASEFTAGTRFRLVEAAPGTIGIERVSQSQNGLQRAYSTLAKIRLNTGNGHGSTNNKIRRFTNPVVNTGSGITYADSATLGATFTVTEDGVYTFTYVDVFSGASNFGISLNSSQLTTGISSITAADALVMGATSGATASYCVTVTLALVAGDVIRPHTDGGAESIAPNRASFTVQRVS